MMKHNLEVVRVEDIEEAEKLKEDWNSLLQDNDTKTPELTYEWQMTYWKYFGAGAKLFILVVKEGDAVVAIAPLKLSSASASRLPIRRLTFIAAEQSNYQDFIIGSKKEEVLDVILAYLSSTSHLWDVLNLSHVPEDSFTAQHCLSTFNGHLRHRSQTHTCMYLNLDESWDAYAAESKKARKKMARHLRKLREAVDCEVTYTDCQDEEQLRANLIKFFELHRAQWNETDTPSQFNDERYRQFYLDVSPQLLRKREIDLSLLAADGQPIAFSYMFRFGSTLIQQLTAYDNDFSKYAPGLVIHEQVVKESFADNTIKTLDFGDYYPYKEFWTENLKTKVDVQVYPKRPWPTFLFLLAGAYHRLRTHLSQHPRLMERVDQLRRRFTS